ncbi:MAG: hypothetical protein ACE147_07195 [Candidatus Methylomirabilales bacterium]|jgi:hypothetical protein
MRLENVQQIILNEQDVKKAAVNGGIRVQLPPGTTQVVIRVEQTLG